MSKRNPHLDVFNSNLEMMGGEMYSDAVNIPIKVFEDVDGNPVYKTPRELFVWFGRLQEQHIQIKEDLSLLDPNWTHAKRLQKFREYVERFESELDESVVFNEIRDWYLGDSEGEMSREEHVKALFQMYRNNIAIWELQYRDELSGEVIQKLKDWGVVFESESGFTIEDKVQDVKVEMDDARPVESKEIGLSGGRRAHLETRIFEKLRQIDVDYPIRNGTRRLTNPAAKYSLEGLERQVVELRKEIEG
jgi:hypothetical protein